MSSSQDIGLAETFIFSFIAVLYPLSDIPTLCQCTPDLRIISGSGALVVGVALGQLLLPTIGLRRH